jgi:UDP-N-acetylmuramate--alanine ligase
MKKHYHFIGIGGAGMSALARIFAEQGDIVTGSDMLDSPTLGSLHREFGIVSFVGHRAENVDGADLVITTAAVRGANPEVDRAIEQGIPIISRAAMLGKLMALYPRSIAVSGTHGKTTTSGMTAQMLTHAGIDPTAVIGGDVPAWQSNARIGSTDVFVAEACEAYGSFLELHPSIAVITNVEPDHLDYYSDMDAIRGAFRTFLSQTSYYAVLCADDFEANKLAGELTDNVATYGLSGTASVRATDVVLWPSSSYTVEILGNVLGRIELSVPGLHNVVNSLAAVTVGNLLDLPFEAIAAGIKSFRGTGRRFEILGTTSTNVLVVDDYAHHPTEIRATLNAAVSAYPGRRIVVVFQPHLPSRTRDLMDEFASSFGEADIVVITDIYLSREKTLDGITGALLAEKTAAVHGSELVLYVADKNNLARELQLICEPGDLLITLGAGDVRMASEQFLHDVSQEHERLAHV